MEIKKAENNQIKSITPIKGEILAKLRSKLSRTNKANVVKPEVTLNNNNHNGQTSTQIKKDVKHDKKIIIESVENVHMDLTSIITNNTANSQVVAGQTDAFVKTDEDSKQSIKILSAIMPENDYNKKIPLKMVRTIQRPKPNIQPRKQFFGHVQVYNSSSAPVIPLETIQEPVQPMNVSTIQQPEHPVENFRGFTEAELHDNILEKLILWKELLSMDDKALNGIKQLSKNLTFNEELSSSASESQIITDSMVDSSMMREFAKDLETTEPQEESDNESSSSESEMDESSDEQSDTEMEIDDAPWLQDIDDLIGEARIKEIEKSLKKIPSKASGNLIETENIELKLIINHLLRKMNAHSVVETMNTDITYVPVNSNNLPTTEDILPKTQNTEEKNKNLKVEVANLLPTTNDSEEQNENIEDDDIPEHFDDTEMDDKSLECCEKEYENMNELVPEKKMSIIEEITIPEVSLPDINEDKTLPNVSEKNSLPAIREVPEGITKEQGTPKEAKAHSLRKRKKEIFPLATSTAKKMKSESTFDLFAMQQKEASSNRAHNTVNNVVSKPQRGRRKDQVQSIKVVVEDISKLVQPIHNKTPERSPSPAINKQLNQMKKDKEMNNEGPPSRRSRRYSKIVSETNVPSKSPSCKTELKSNDLNSSESAVNVYQDYLNTPSSPSLDLARKREPIVEKSLVEQVTESVAKIKTADPTFHHATEQKEKRPYLRTSAFKGNQDDDKNLSNHTADSVSNSNDTPEDSNSISHELSHEKDSPQKLNLKELMQSLIEGRKEIITKNNPQKPAIDVPKNKIKTKKADKPRVKQFVRELISLPKKVFEQEPLEPAVESKVPYDSIIESIRVSNPPRSREKGKAVWIGHKFDENDIKTWRGKLRKEKYFRCGMCKFLVTKHKWKQHLEAHGVFTYIDGFETPLDVTNWNESLRRIIQYCKIYKIDTLRCPNCDSVKRSPLGQLSHIYVCGEDEETLECRKMICDMCSEKFLPIAMSAHKKTCKGSEVQYKYEEDKQQCEKEENETIYTSSGRAKRKVVQKAEKKLETIVNKLRDEQGSDFGDSSSEEFNNESDESSESEESSGVDEDEQSVAESSEQEDNSKTVKFCEKGRKKTCETAEYKFARSVLQDYVEDIRTRKLSTKIYELNSKFIEKYFSKEIFLNLVSNYQTLSQTLGSFFNHLNFRPTSINYVLKQTDTYLANFEKSQIKSDWKELACGSCDLKDSSHILIYCGGSVSSMDWAPTEDTNHYLAVACNPNDIQHKMGIEQSIKACVQIYEFNSLVSHKFQNFSTVTSRLLYAFAINDGPIWSVKFHPCGQATNEKIGILAVTTAQQDVLIFSLPYLNNNNLPAVIELNPNIVCRLSEDIILYQDRFLLQATRLNWYYEKDRVNALAVGYVTGYVAIWNFEGREDEGDLRYPDIIIQAHRETITSIDMKPGGVDGQYFLLTSCLGREIKLFSIKGCKYEELTVSQPSSRILCAQMWRHWAGYVNGNDISFTLGFITHRQPFDFGRKNTLFMNLPSSIVSIDINHWTNTVLFTTDAGDVISVTPHQLISTDPKDRWNAFESTIISFTDIKRIPQKNQAPDELGIVFNDMRSNARKKPKNFRVSPIELANQLQVNHACFNPNEKSHRFFALGYETGFVRIQHMKHHK